MPQEALGRHEDQWFAEVPLHLTPEDVEILGGRGQVADLDVVFGAELQKPLKPGAGVLRALSFITVGQEHDQAADPLPL